jgi:hypothetical protein
MAAPVAIRCSWSVMPAQPVSMKAAPRTAMKDRVERIAITPVLDK